MQKNKNRTDADGNPLVDFGIDADGTPWFALASRKNEDEYGMQFSILWSRDLVNWQTLGECRFDQDGDEDPTACHPPVNTTVEPRMFFKYRIEIGND
jgi:hypothetical protein